MFDYISGFSQSKYWTEQRMFCVLELPFPDGFFLHKIFPIVHMNTGILIINLKSSFIFVSVL